MIPVTPGHLPACPCVSCRAQDDALDVLGNAMTPRAPKKDLEWLDRKASSWWSLTLLLLPVQLYINAWTLLCAWEWFVMPLGAPAIGVAHAGGLLSAMALLRHAEAPKLDPNATNVWMVRKTSEVWLRLLFSWLALAFWHWCAT